MTLPDYTVAAIRGAALLCALLAGGVALWRTLMRDADARDPRDPREPRAHGEPGEPGKPGEPGEPGELPPAAEAGPAASADNLFRVVGLFAGIAAIVLVLAELMLQPARMLGSFAGIMDRELLGFALGSDLGTAAAMRLSGLVLVVSGLMSTHAGSAARSVLAVGGAVLVAASWSFAGHTATSDLRWILGPSLTAHVVIVMFWVGGVAGLWFASRTAEPVRLARRTAAFSRMAIVPVPMIAILGLIMAWGLVPEWRALMSGYGLLLLAKASGFAMLLALAAVNRWSLTPRLAAGEVAATGSLRRTLMAEAALLALVLVLTTVMTVFYSPYQVVR